MLAILKDSTESLTAVLSGAPSTTQPKYSVISSSNNISAQAQGAMTGSTAVTLLTGAGAVQEIKAVHIYNEDTSTILVTLAKVISGVSYTQASISVPAASTLQWDENGLVVLTGTATAPTASVGAASVATVSANEQIAGFVHQTTLTLTDLAITMRDTEQGGGAKIYDFPEGRILILGAVASIAVTTTSAILTTLNGGKTCNWGQASATVATTEQNLIPVTAFTSSATIDVAGATATAALAASAQFDGTATAIDAYLNLAVAGATDIDGDATVTVDGTVTLTWVFLGDI